MCILNLNKVILKSNGFKPKCLPSKCETESTQWLKDIPKCLPVLILNCR